MLRRQSRTGDQDRAAASQPSQRDEIGLIDRIERKDLRAFETLYRIYHPRLTRFLVNIIRRPHLVGEALNDTMMVVWDRPDSYNGTSRWTTAALSCAPARRWGRSRN